jgi:hypothetical protein
MVEEALACPLRFSEIDECYEDVLPTIVQLGNVPHFARWYREVLR